MEKKHFATIGYDTHSIPVSSECDIYLSWISYRKLILQGSWAWIDNCLGYEFNSLFLQKENGKHSYEGLDDFH